MDDPDDLTEAIEREGRRQDPALEPAKKELRAFFDEQPLGVFYSTQIETLFERDFFHWIIGRGLLELANAGEIRRITTPVGEQHVNFYANRRHRYVQRQVRSMVKLLERIFDPEFSHAIGRHGELMFDAALGRHGFRAEATNASSWGTRKWVRTNSNLDRIITRDGAAYGIEIKNTQSYIPRNELLVKIEMCKFLELTPLFIMRFAPKSYMYEIYRSGGFGLLFEEQIYPWGHEALLRQVKDELRLKVQSPRNVKEGDMERLVRWHTKHRANR